MLIKIFTKDSCPNCPSSKKLGEELKQKGLNVEFFDVKTPKGLAESLMHNVLSTPSTVIVKENTEVCSFLGKTPEIDEVTKWLL